MDWVKAIKEAKEKSKKRNFIQSLELILNFERVDFSKTENRINMDVLLPKGRGKDVKVAVIAGKELLPEAKKTADKVLTEEDVVKLGKDKKEAKKLASQYHAFICQANLMPLVGKELGQVLGPRGKMPTPVPPNAKLEPIIKRLKNSVKIRTKGKFLPTLHAPIGTEDMSDEDLAENAKAVYNAVVQKLPQKEANVKSVYIKTSMGPSVKVV